MIAFREQSLALASQRKPAVLRDLWHFGRKNLMTQTQHLIVEQETFCRFQF